MRSELVRHAAPHKSVRTFARRKTASTSWTAPYAAASRTRGRGLREAHTDAGMAHAQRGGHRRA